MERRLLWGGITRRDLLVVTEAIRWRARLLGLTFWVVSVIVVEVAALFSNLSTSGSDGLTLFLLFAPLLPCFGLAYGLHTLRLGLREVELSCPLGFVEVTALAVIGGEFTLSVMATAVLAAAGGTSPLLVLVGWGGPFLLGGALALAVTVRKGSMWAGATCVLSWGLLAAVCALVSGLATTHPSLVPADPATLVLHLGMAAWGGAWLARMAIRVAAAAAQPCPVRA